MMTSRPMLPRLPFGAVVARLTCCDARGVTGDGAATVGSVGAMPRPCAARDARPRPAHLAPHGPQHPGEEQVQQRQQHVLEDVEELLGCG